MMTTLKVRFDGHVLVPEQPVVLPQDRVLEIYVEDDKVIPTKESSLADIADWAEQLPTNHESPGDGAAQHDHYLYGTPKRS